jgi:hypothetical protein
VATLSHNIFPASSGFVAVAPTTVLDTFLEPLPIAAGGFRTVTVGGVGGVPATGVVPVLSIAVLGWDAGFVQLYPTGQAQPNSSQFSLSEFELVTDIEVVPMGTNSQITLFSFGESDMQIDVIGYIPLGGSFSPASPVRILDTRTGSGAPQGVLAAGAQLDLGVAGAGGVPGGATDALAIVTTVNATAVGSLTVWDTGGTAPVAPSVRWVTPASAQFVVVHLSAGGQATIKNSSSSTSIHVLVDIVGYFT